MAGAPPKVVVLGGGTGSYELLLGLKDVTPHLTAVVNMCDDGGSTGRLRAGYGVMPPGDVRQCLVALAGDEAAAKLLSYRFGEGELAGHPVGNLLLSAGELRLGDFGASVQEVSRMLRSEGVVLPVTETNHVLVMEDGDETIRGQEQVRLHQIKHPSEVRLRLEPVARITAEARDAIEAADFVVFAPGGLNWTLLPICLVDGVPDALQRSRAQVICVANLMNRPEQHIGWHVVDYVQEFQKYLGEDVVHAVLYNTGKIPEVAADRYAADGHDPVGCAPHRFAEIRAEAIGTDLVARALAVQDSADTSIERSRIRHDSDKTGAALKAIFADRR